MEQARYWMWTRRKFNGNSDLLTASYNDSWEEQAFAEDSSGPLGGCIWPPRSYSCSFCRREFRSAQALGGHMNVHRRDRARLRQSPTGSRSENHHHHHQNPCTLLGIQCPSEVRNLVCPDPNFQSPLSSSRVSAPLTAQENCNDQNLVSAQPPPSSSTKSSSYSSPYVHEHQKVSLCSPHPLLSDSIAFQLLSVKRDRLSPQEMDCRIREDSLKPDSAVSSLDLVFRQKRPDFGEGEEAISCKRLKNNASLPFFIRPSAPIEELDLELRLGDRPKVK